MKFPRIAYLSNDIGGRDSWPAAAPGLRAFSFAGALQGKAETKIFCPSKPALRSVFHFGDNSPICIYDGDGLSAALQSFAPDIVVSQNGNHLPFTATISRAEIWLDFFSPRFLEFKASERWLDAEKELRRFAQSLQYSSRVICNGSRKMSLLSSISGLEKSSGSPAIHNVPFGFDNEFFNPHSLKRSGSTRKILLGGYSQSWRDSTWITPTLDILQNFDTQIFVLFGSHRGAGRIESAQPEHFSSDNVTFLPTLSLRQYKMLLSQMDLFVDLSQESDERKYAWPARTAMALSSGVPVLHPLQSEISNLIVEKGLGRLISIDNPAFLVDIREAIEDLFSDRLPRFEPPFETSVSATRASILSILEP